MLSPSRHNKAVIQLEGHNIPAKFLPLGGVAVVANNTYAALKGRDALVIDGSGTFELRGVVTLSGSVDRESVRERAVRVARGCDGVEKVVDRITVGPGGRT